MENDEVEEVSRQKSPKTHLMFVAPAAWGKEVGGVRWLVEVGVVMA